MVQVGKYRVLGDYDSRKNLKQKFPVKLAKLAVDLLQMFFYTTFHHHVLSVFALEAEKIG
jgi:hypothetical protein